MNPHKIRSIVFRSSKKKLDKVKTVVPLSYLNTPTLTSGEKDRPRRINIVAEIESEGMMTRKQIKAYVRRFFPSDGLRIEWEKINYKPLREI